MSDGSKKNSAVSPVIGTILLVAITVVLIAVITAVVMGLADAEDGKKVGMNAQPDNIDTAKAKLILYGGESISELIKLEMIDHDSPSGEYVLLWEGAAGTVSVGVPYPTEENVARPPEDMKVYDTHINVKGTFTDGREVILLVQPMTFYNVEGPKTPSPIAKYIDKIVFQGVDITNNHGKVTTGFKADYTGEPWYSLEGWGATIMNYPITVTLKDPLPDGYTNINIRFNHEAVTPGYKDNWHRQLYGAGSGGDTIIFNEAGFNMGYVGIGSTPTGQWNFTVQIYDGPQFIASDYWIVEATAPLPPTDIRAYVDKVVFQGVDITENQGPDQMTTGFTAQYPGDSWYKATGHGARVTNGILNVTLVDPLPYDYASVAVNVQRESVTPGYESNRYIQLFGGGSSGDIVTFSDMMWSGLASSPIGQWKFTIIVLDGATQRASGTWYVEASIP